MMSLFNFIIASSFVLLSSIAAVILKKAERRDILVLWTMLFMYVFAHIGFFIVKMHSGLTFYQTVLFTLNLYTDNIPFYIIRSISVVLGNILLFYLLNNFPVSQVILVLQMAIPISAICFTFLGNPLTLNVVIGTVIVTIGAIISGFKKFEFPNIFKPLFAIPTKLYLVGILKACTRVFGALLLFTVSTRTTETTALHHILKHAPFFDLTHLTFYTTIDYAIGMAPWVLVTYFLYFFIVEKITFTDMADYAKEHRSLVLLNGSIMAFSYFAYAYAFGHIADKFLMAIFGKCQIPLTLLFASYLINEKITFPQKVATVVILTGSVLSIL
ncbi:MAG: putative membrane protein [Alteromonas naphthalenivorans]|jgi:uncharacterized membrane protein